MKLYKLFRENVYPPSEKEMIRKSGVGGRMGFNKRGCIECIVKNDNNNFQLLHENFLLLFFVKLSSYFSSFILRENTVNEKKEMQTNIYFTKFYVPSLARLK